MTTAIGKASLRDIAAGRTVVSPATVTLTQLAAPDGGTGATEGAYDTEENRDLFIDSVNALRADIIAVRQAIIDNFGIIAAGHDVDLSLLYQFAKAKTLESIDGLGPTLTLVRATEATYFDENGVMQIAASGEARFGYDPVTKLSLGILMEEVRTNSQEGSDDIDNATYWTPQFATVAASSVVAPDGSFNATTLTIDAGADMGRVGTAVGSVVAITDTEIWTSSVFVKAGTHSVVQLFVSSAPFPVAYADFDLSLGVVSEVSAATAAIQDVGGGWYRCSMTITADASDNSIVGIAIPETPTANRLTDWGTAAAGTENITVWGAQLELSAGRGMSSYIPTVASTVTRNREEVRDTDMTWYNGTQGTMFAVIAKMNEDGNAGEFPRIFDIGIAGQSSDENGIGLVWWDGPDIQFHVRVGNATEASLQPATAVSWTGPHLVSAAYAADDFAASANGSTAITDSLGDVALGMNQFRIGANGTGATVLNGHISEIRYYSIRKSNQFLEDLSNGLLKE